MQMKVKMIMMLVSSLLAVGLASQSETPASVAERFCRLELSGIGLYGGTSRSLLDLTTGEEEPFNNESEVASGCKILRTRTLSASAAEVLVEYHVVGKIEEVNGGLKKVFVESKNEEVRLQLLYIQGNWKITRKSLWKSPVYATAEAWAKNFQDLLDSSDKSHPDLDANLKEVISRLKQM